MSFIHVPRNMYKYTALFITTNLRKKNYIVFSKKVDTFYDHTMDYNTTEKRYVSQQY